MFFWFFSQVQQKYAQNVSIILLSQSSRQYLFVFFFFLAILFLSPCTKKYSSPLISSRFRFSYFQELSRAYQVVTARILNDVHTAASPCGPLPPSLTCLISSRSFARVQLCPLAEVAHLLSLGTDFKGPGHIWLLWGGGDEAHRTLKAWGELETVTNRTAAVGGMDTVGVFFFSFFFLPEEKLSIRGLYKVGHRG